jgi:two-component system sensor histidine kinase/response regulator
MKILIIEDEEAIRETLRDLLELNGHSVTDAADGLTGVQRAKEQPELILCDIGLPGLNGYQVLAALQQLPECRDIPFIFLTAWADRQDQRKGMALGADDYITKPFTQKEILDAIEARIRRQRPLRERLEELLRQQKTEIGANWSHELLTPLTGLMGGLELIEAEADQIKPADLKELLALIRKGAEQQEALSRKLILHYELEKLKAMPPARPATCLTRNVEAAAQRQAGIDRRAADLTVMVEHAHVPLVEQHLGAVVTELVGNACRFSAPGQPVTVSGRRQDGRYLIEVTDQGTGMTAAECAAIGPYIQFGRAKREQQGLGLGLAIAQAAAHLAGGKFHVEPGPGGRGVRAVLDLPLAPA